jgi:uridylate kinase
MRTIVLSLGGSAIVPESINASFLNDFKTLITGFVSEGNRAIIVCGGGMTARKYQQGLKDIITPSPESLDWLGIYATRINALLIKEMFGSLAYGSIITDPTQKIITSLPIMIASGWKPGFSSDMDAVLLAEQFNASEVINISNIEYVYDKDPKKHPSAKKLETISWSEFRKIVGDSWIPGLNMPFDPIAAKKAHELKLKVIVLNMNLENLRSCINDDSFNGTTIS